ncbi:cytochrome P450 87A3-like [Papaver somniferum]|uniref:cytochrome P450 87A3-like n=1 Tax=Papaver somniferum TaxID=3469 RepID=UPI000E705C17|nr:cytochrome P450 87A3-like [Papaver somniferum]
MVVSLDPDFNHFIFQQERKTVRLWYSDSFSSIFGDVINSQTDTQILKYFRNSLVNIFGTKSLKENFFPKLEVLANQYLQTWSTQPSVELKASITSAIFDLTAEHLFHYDANSSSDKNLGIMFADFFKSIMTFPINIPGTAFYRCMQNQKKAIQLMREILHERYRSTEKKGDFLDQVIEDMKSETKEFMTEDFVMYYLFGILLSTFATISSNLTLALTFLTDHPAVVKELLEEQEEISKSRGDNRDTPLTWEEYKTMKFMSQVLTETLGMSNIAPALLRKTTKDIHVNGYVIPEGWGIMLVSSAVHMNPDKFPDPQKFDPWRWNDINTSAPLKDFMPFGGGMRHCVGADFSKTLMAIFIRALITNFSDETYYPYRDISVLVMDINMTLFFPHMDREKIDLKEFEQILRVKLRLTENEIPNLYWMIEPCLPEIMDSNEDLFKFWEHAVADDK